MMLRRLPLLLVILATTARAQSTDDNALPSWNDGAARHAILDFVHATTDRSSPTWVPPEERVATFDQDGTLWVEHPIYAQATFAVDRVKALSAAHPEWSKEEPFKSILAEGDRAMVRLTAGDWIKLLAQAQSGADTEEFHQLVGQWLATARHPRFHRPWTDLIYQPMLEVMQFLRAHGFKTYIVTGGGQEFVRSYAERVYGVPPEQVIGSSAVVKYELRDGQPVLIPQPEPFFVDNNDGKAIGINLFIGRRPQAAFGNSTGDRQMLQWTGAGPGPRLKMLVLHDDPVREYAYGPAEGLPETKVGTFPESLLHEARDRGWIVIHMKSDWKRVFPFEPLPR